MQDYMLAQEELNNDFNEIESMLNRVGLATTTAISIENNSDEPNLETISSFIGHDISLEDNDLNIFKTRINEVYESLNKMVFTKFKTLSPLVSKTSQYKLNELQVLMNKINAGDLVPLENIDPKRTEAFNRKLKVFYASGYGIENSSKDLTDYMGKISGLTDKSGKYFKGIMSMYEQLNAPTKQLNVPKMTGIMNVKPSLGGIVETVERKVRVNDFRLSLVKDWFSNRVELVIVSNSVKKGIRVHTDTYNVTVNKKVKKANNSDTLKMLEFGIKHASKLDSIHGAISLTIKKIARDNTIQLVQSASGGGSGHRFLVAKYSEAVIKSLIGLYRNMIYFDSIMIEYVKLTYRVNTGKPKVIDTTK